ncbi:uncharacterized protein Ndc80 [Anoplolepis gracilipes]|uniref:uncharacterized protein Ndc80 n=1 Tax=Anoplolepis gracilipes TaxID=354296 RepID=UPI003B9F96E8
MDRARNDQRRTQTLKPKRVSTDESHIPRPRFRSSSCDRASLIGRKSYLKSTGIGKTPVHLSTTPVTPLRASTKLNMPSSARPDGHLAALAVGRSPSGDRANNAGPRRDTRPLADKSYQMELLNKIDNFFHVNQRSSMLNSNGSLKPITLNMFVEVSNFLLKFLDIKEDLTTKTYIVEIPKYAKYLHYPGLISKSWLKTANVPHSWPNVLGWIGWLVEACQLKELAFNKYQLETLPFVETEQAESPKMEFITMLECYKAWNDGESNEETKLLEKYQQDVMTQKGISKEDINQAHNELEENTLKLQIIEKESQEVDRVVRHLNERLSFWHDKEDKQLNNIKAKEDYIKKLSAETNQLNAERDVLNEQLRKGNIQYKELMSTVKDQPMSKSEKEKIVKECTEIQNYIHGFDEHLTDYQKELYTLDIKFASFNNDLNKAILVYNKEIFMHTDNDIDVNFDELKLPEKGLLNPQIMDIMKEKVVLMDTFKELLTKQSNEMDSHICSETTKLEKLQEEIKSTVNEDKLEEEESCIDKMRTDMRNEKIELTKQIEVLKNEIKGMQDMMPDIKTIDLEIEEAKDKLNAVIRRQTFLEQSAEQFFDRFYQIIGEHRSELYDILTKKT